VVADAVAADPSRRVTLLAHSLGGIACVDALIEEAIPGVERLVTVGSQAPFFYEIDALSALPYGKPLPDQFPAWLNIYDSRDFLSYIAAGVFPDRVTDKRVDNRQPFPLVHSAYWCNAAVWQHIREFLA
jgi:pimeloyl-ACP methyl ester carboxylesterase